MEAKESKFNITETIRAMRKAREELKHAQERERQLFTPMLKDYAMLPKLYDMFMEIKGDSVSDVDSRDMFVFVIQYLYSPRNYFGDRMPKELCKKIAKTVGIKSKSPISRSSCRTLHYYQVYTKYREKTKEILSAMLERLQGEGVIK